MKIQEHDQVVLTAGLPAQGLESGDVGTVVHVHRDGEAYEVEFMTLAGDTLAVATVPVFQLWRRPGGGGIGFNPLEGHLWLFLHRTQGRKAA